VGVLEAVLGGRFRNGVLGILVIGRVGFLIGFLALERACFGIITGYNCHGGLFGRLSGSGGRIGWVCWGRFLEGFGNRGF
jgi:hypothetical protein